MKKIITSVAMIAAIGALVVGATGAFFNDEEKSLGNTFTAGTIDIDVNGENPWTTSWKNYLDKPSQTNYMNFTVKNVGENPASLWKRLTAIENGPGAATYCGASSEPEYVDGGGQMGPGICENGAGPGSGYAERDNLSAFMIYDMAICKVGVNEVKDAVCPMMEDSVVNDVAYYKPVGGGNWVTVVDEEDQIRVDNIADTWIKLGGELGVGESLVVSQSYHLTTWTDSGQPMIANWAQGDVMAFDVELDARQLTAPAPGTIVVNDVVRATASLVRKNTTTWDPIENGANGTLTYDVEGANFKYDFTASGLVDGDYQLIYYPDPWASPKTIVLIGSPVTAVSGSINASGDADLNTDLPSPTDANFGVGAKVWLVPTSSLSGSNLSWTGLDNFLFDLSLVNYTDTDD